MSEKLKNQDKKLDPITCELAVEIHDKMRYTHFMTTKELEKLQTCHNLEKVKKFFEWEKEILEIIFLENPQLEKKKDFVISIPTMEVNFPLLELIEAFSSVEYIIYKAWGSPNIKALELSIKKDKNKKFYISNMEVIKQ